MNVATVEGKTTAAQAVRRSLVLFNRSKFADTS
jgi:hypothetical protein